MVTRGINGVCWDSTSATVTATLPSGLVEADAAGFEIFPNPATSEITISFRQPTNEAAVIEVLDISGRLLMSDQLEAGIVSRKLALKAIPPGVYTVRLLQNKAYRSSLLVVE